MSRLNYLLDADFAIPLDLGVQAFMEDDHARRAIMAMAHEALSRWKPAHGEFDLAAQAAAVTLAVIYANDGALKNVTAERDRLQEQLLEVSRLVVRPIIIQPGDL